MDPGGSSSRGRRGPARQPQGPVDPDEDTPTIRHIPYETRPRLPQPNFQRPQNLALHPLLLFRDGSDPHARLDKLLPCDQFQHRTYSFQLLDALGASQQFRDLLGDKWLRVLECNGPQYHELTLEFHSTLELRRHEFNESTAVSFALGGKTYEMSVPAFAVHTGFYTDAEAHSPEFPSLVRGLWRKENDVGPTRATLGEFWSTISTSSFSTDLTESSISSPLHRYIHRILAGTLFARNSGRDKVNNWDLVSLYCILTRQQANLASFLIGSVRRGRRKGDTTILDQGPYIAQLAANLGVFTRWPARLLTSGLETRPFRLEELQKSHIISDSRPPTWGHPPQGAPAHGPVVGEPSHREPRRPRVITSQPPTTRPSGPVDMSTFRTELLGQMQQYHTLQMNQIHAYHAIHQRQYQRHEDAIRAMMEHQSMPVPEWFAPGTVCTASEWEAAKGGDDEEDAGTNEKEVVGDSEEEDDEDDDAEDDTDSSEVF